MQRLEYLSYIHMQGIRSAAGTGGGLPAGSRVGSAEREGRPWQDSAQLHGMPLAGSSRGESTADLEIIVGRGKRSFNGEGVLRQAATQVNQLTTLQRPLRQCLIPG